MIFYLIILALAIGTLMPIQAGINAELTRFLQNPYLAATISFGIGTLALLLLLIIKGVSFEEIKRIGSTSPHLLIGGVLGAIFVSSSIFFIPKLGATTMIAAYITGQLVMSVIMDHYGFFGITPSPASLTRIVGCILLFAGLFLVVKRGT